MKQKTAIFILTITEVVIVNKYRWKLFISLRYSYLSQHNWAVWDIQDASVKWRQEFEVGKCPMIGIVKNNMRNKDKQG